MNNKKPSKTTKKLKQSPPKKTGKTWFGIVISSAVILATVAVVVFGLLPQNKSRIFKQQSKPIFERLNQTIKELTADNVSYLQNGTLDFETAKIVWAKNNSDLEASVAETISLEEQYSELQPSIIDFMLVEKHKKAFKLAKSIQNKYKKTVDLRLSIFDAYGGVPGQLDIFFEAYSKGGKIADFITKTDNIKTEAGNAIERMKKINNVSPDDAPYYKGRLSYLDASLITFTKLNEYYRAQRLTEVDNEIKIYDQKNNLRDSTFFNQSSNLSILEDVRAFEALNLSN